MQTFVERKPQHSRTTWYTIDLNTLTPRYPAQSSRLCSLRTNQTENAHVNVVKCHDAAPCRMYTVIRFVHAPSHGGQLFTIEASPTCTQNITLFSRSCLERLHPMAVAATAKPSSGSDGIGGTSRGWTGVRAFTERVCVCVCLY